jgi:hypothetical protein
MEQAEGTYSLFFWCPNRLITRGAAFTLGTDEGIAKHYRSERCTQQTSGRYVVDIELMMKPAETLRRVDTGASLNAFDRTDSEAVRVQSNSDVVTKAVHGALSSQVMNSEDPIGFI